jgi:biopolymer transport protein ExbB/TolQ
MPLLLEGLKTAFITSGVGIFVAILLSIFKPIRHNRSETLEALEIVVKEFNKNLTEQFGDNFKLLNESVKSMIIWQENYRTHIASSEKTLENIITQLKKVELVKQEEKESIQKLILNLEHSSSCVKTSLETTTDIVKDQMQLLLREANRRL